MRPPMSPDPSTSLPVALAGQAAGHLQASSVLPTLNDDGSRRWLKPRVSPGRFLSRRRVVAYLLIALFALLPVIHVNGRPLVLLDIAARRFHILGTTFYPTDTL